RNAAAAELRAPRARPARARRLRERRLAGGRAVLGDLAVRDVDPAARAGVAAAGRRPGRAPPAGRAAGEGTGRVRSAVRGFVSLLDGLARRAVRRQDARPLAATRARLPAAAAVGDGEEVHGRLRAARRAAARPDRGGRRRAPAGADPLIAASQFVYGGALLVDRLRPPDLASA